MALPSGTGPILDRFAAAIRPAAGVTALYVGGSLATGDYRPGISDMDLAALIARPLNAAQQDGVQRVHRELIGAEPAAAKLHCVYVPAGELADLAREHWTWAVGDFFSRTFSGVARAELRAYGFAVFGDPPAAVIPAVDLDAAVISELTGYWTWALSRDKLWLEDSYVDLSLVTLARVQATLAGRGLITKREAISRLGRLGVPGYLAEEIRRRRDGEQVPVSARYRTARAELTRRLVSEGIARLTSSTD